MMFLHRDTPLLHKYDKRSSKPVVFINDYTGKLEIEGYDDE